MSALESILTTLDEGNFDQSEAIDAMTIICARIAVDNGWQYEWIADCANRMAEVEEIDERESSGGVMQ